MIERLVEAIKPDTSRGEEAELPVYETNRRPGSTAEVDLWTSREVREVAHSHLNYVAADTKVWEEAAAYAVDTHPTAAERWVKAVNADGTYGTWAYAMVRNPGAVPSTNTNAARAGVPASR